MTDTLEKFYNGKTLFLTGASGFLGTYFLEILLRCFPGIARIYILLRPKKGVEPYQRKEEIFKKKILKSIARNNPELMEKVQVISGDISLPNLGMNKEDLRKFCNEVTIVFHGAANISFFKPYRTTSLQNAKSTDHVINVCRMLKKLEVLVYTSTAYSNSHLYPETIKEKIYLLPHKAQRFLDEMENGTDESYEELVSSLNLNIINAYCFSKFVSENILLEKASDLPVAIVRPSIVVMTWKGPIPGCIENGTGIADLCTGVGKGFIRVLLADNNCLFDLVPVDVVANAHIVTAWSVATGRSPSMFVVNCTSGDTMKLTFGEFRDTMLSVTKKNPLPKGFQEVHVTTVKSKILYAILTLYQHYIPAIVLDIFLRLKGNKLRLVKLYRFFYRITMETYPFVSKRVTFQTDNFHGLSKQLIPEEREMIYTDITCKFADLANNLPSGCEMFDWDTDKFTPKRRRNVVLQRTMVITFIKRFTLLLFIYLIYSLISKMFF